ncbi:MAG: YraN family protein [Alphaproteobacteria bacterium]|nr:YraN family protein [Alphaproteobacteria bacterium]
MRLWRRRGSDRQARQAAEEGGRQAEAWAVLWLRLKGYRILAQRLKTPMGELDVIARRGKTICFVEMKARTKMDRALEALAPKQRHRIERAAAWWCARHIKDSSLSMRFDLIAVAPGRLPVHLVDAWQV